MFRPPHRQEQQWGLISVEIVAVGTALAAATIVATVALPDWIIEAIGEYGRRVVYFLAAVSLVTYLVAVCNGLSAPFQDTASERKASSKRAAFAVMLQTAMVFGIILFLILSFLEQQLAKAAGYGSIH